MATTKKEVVSAPAEYKTVRLNEIHIIPNWNCRLYLEHATDGEDETNSLESLGRSIQAKGQDTPVDVRPNPDARTASAKPYSLVTGFRRYAAISKCAETDAILNPTIRIAIHKGMTEQEARELNMRENTARDSLGGADLAFGIAKLRKELAKGDKGDDTGTAIAASLGKSQPYVSKLIRIMTRLDKVKTVDGKEDVLNHWRVNSVNRLTVDTMKGIADCEGMPKNTATPDVAAWQAARYEMLTRDAVAPPKERDATKWIASTHEACKEIGTTLGAVVRAGGLKIVDDDFFAVHLKAFVNVKANATAAQLADFADKFEEAFLTALTAEVVAPVPPAPKKATTNGHAVSAASAEEEEEDEDDIELRT